MEGIARRLAGTNKSMRRMHTILVIYIYEDTKVTMVVTLVPSFPRRREPITSVAFLDAR
jgi:hypothetical protein